jgi:hypothetical protein
MRSGRAAFPKDSAVWLSQSVARFWIFIQCQLVKLCASPSVPFPHPFFHLPPLTLTPPLQQVSAIEYTAGPICYTVNPFLRSCNETAWLFPDITIKIFFLPCVIILVHHH